LQPDRLNATPRQRHTEESFTLALIEDPDTDNQVVVVLGLHPFEEGPFIGSRLIADSGGKKPAESFERHVARPSVTRLNSAGTRSGGQPSRHGSTYSRR
jgi:hypothetical protein